LDQPLTAEQIAEFFQQGFLVIDTPLIEKPELAWCSNILMRMLESGEGRSEGRNLDLIAKDGSEETTLPSVLQPSLYATELRKLSYRKTALAIARQLLGAQAGFAGDHTIFKPVHKGGPTPWHQDEAFREPGFEYDEISIWIAMTDSTIENGAMAYIPGSHKLGLLPHAPSNVKGNSLGLVDHPGVDALPEHAIEVKRGSVVLHHALTVHHSQPNRSARPRRGLVYIYMSPNVKLVQPERMQGPAVFPELE